MSEQPKHTGGDWQAERGESGGYIEWFVRRDGDSRAIARDILDPETGLPSEANANLIAAAKDLMEALKAIVEYADDPALCDDPADLVNQARAAIAKAEGRGE
jgi:hypothetical protein